MKLLLSPVMCVSFALLAACGHTESIGPWEGKPVPHGGASALLGPAAERSAPTQPEIRVLSNRADLVSGGDALVEIVLPAGTRSSEVRVDADGRDITSAFAVRSNGGYMGLVTGLALGQNVLTVRFPEGRGQRIVITNHPKGGPVFAGPQVAPWICTTEKYGLGPALDAQCNAVTRVSYVYQPTNRAPGTYKPYDPKSPPGDVAITTTDEGHKVPYIVRVELGTLDRSIYRLAVLADPSKPWEPWSPQEGWNGKVFIPFGGGCGTPHRQEPPTEISQEQSVLRHKFLSRGWMGTTSGLNALGLNCNEVVSAEAVMMQKEHIEAHYGPIRHTIGLGGSGGSIQQNNIAAAYPGLLDGVTTNSTFPDAWTTFSDVIDCDLLSHYFLKTSPGLWRDNRQAAAVMGKPSLTNCRGWTLLFSDIGDPQNRGGLGIGLSPVRWGCKLPGKQTYDPVNNPGGVRCSVQDYQVAIWGRRGPKNAAPVPFDNVGLQYGLQELRSGVISVEQFVDLNSKLGGLDSDWEFVRQRMSMDLDTVTTLHRASRLSDPRQLAKVAIIDVRNNPNDGDIHQPYFSWVMRARLDAINGGHGNQVIWNHPGDAAIEDAVFAMDHWLMAVEGDRSDLPLEQKIVNDRPADLRDACWIDGRQIVDPSACRSAYPYSADARIEAGGPFDSLIRKCQLRPLNRDDYNVSFTDTQWTQLQSAFADGVCDWTKPAVGYHASVPWMTYAAGPGGQPLGPAPQSTGF